MTNTYTYTHKGDTFSSYVSMKDLSVIFIVNILIIFTMFHSHQHSDLNTTRTILSILLIINIMTDSLKSCNN